MLRSANKKQIFEPRDPYLKGRHAVYIYTFFIFLSTTVGMVRILNAKFTTIKNNVAVVKYTL